MDRHNRQVTLNLDDVEHVVNFASEMLVRLAFFTQAPMSEPEKRAEAAHQRLDEINTLLHQHLDKRMEDYGEEYDNAGTPVPGCDIPDNGSE